VTGKHVIQSNHSELTTSVTTLTSVEACRAHHGLTVDVFGAASPQALHSGISLAEALIRVRGNPCVSSNGKHAHLCCTPRCFCLWWQNAHGLEAVEIIRRMFSEFGADSEPRVAFPCHIVSRGYTVLGDAAVLTQRFAVAEQYYCLALKACEAAGTGGDSHPYTMLLLDRLMGAVVAQGRNEHAVALVHLFQVVWGKFTCPSKLSLPLPLVLVFGKAIPNAFVLAHEQIPANAGCVRVVVPVL
jgi:hypothetical protein